MFKIIRDYYDDIVYTLDNAESATYSLKNMPLPFAIGYLLQNLCSTFPAQAGGGGGGVLIFEGVE